MPIPAALRDRTLRARPCDRCGNFASVFVTWAVPLNEGGLESGWNTLALCTACRIRRDNPEIEKREQELAEQKGRKKWRQRVKVGGRVFADVQDAADFMGKSKQTIYNWIYAGRHGAQYVRG